MGERQVEMFKMHPGLWLPIGNRFSLCAVSAHVAPRKSGDWDIETVLSDWNGEGEEGMGTDGKGPGVCQPGFTRDTEPVGYIH